MDWIELQKGMNFSSKISERGRSILALRRVVDGTLYDHIQTPFYRAYGDINNAGSYIPVHDRRPSVKTRLCTVVVEDSASMLFGEHHFPLITTDADAEDADPAWLRVSDMLHLPELMEQAAIIGSVGSVAIHVQIANGEITARVLNTEYLTPVFDPHNPQRLVSVRHQFVTTGSALAEVGFTDIDPDDTSYFYSADYAASGNVFYMPVPSAGSAPPSGDSLVPVDDLFVDHGLGCVPIVWIRNLPGSDPTAPDGKATFEAGIDPMIEADYLLSQTVRGLRYASDPTMVVSGDDAIMPGLGGPIPREASTAITIPADGAVKLLEMSGDGAAMNIRMWESLRELALEAMHGNRSHGDKLSAAQSGRAMEMMMQGMTWLCGRLRHPYGRGLIELLTLIGKIRELHPDAKINGRACPELSYEGVGLRWGPWFEPTFADMQTLSQAVTGAAGAGVISRTTAVGMMRPATRLRDVTTESCAIIADIEAREARIKAAGGTIENKSASGE